MRRALLELLAKLVDSSSAPPEPASPLLPLSTCMEIEVCGESRELIELVLESSPIHSVCSSPIRTQRPMCFQPTLLKCTAPQGALQCSAKPLRLELWMEWAKDWEELRMLLFTAEIYSAAVLVSCWSADNSSLFGKHTAKKSRNPLTVIQHCQSVSLCLIPHLCNGSSSDCLFVKVFQFWCVSCYRSVNSYCMQVRGRFFRLVQT